MIGISGWRLMLSARCARPCSVSIAAARLILQPSRMACRGARYAAGNGWFCRCVSSKRWAARLAMARRMRLAIGAARD